MLDLSWIELFFVGVLALIIIGPKDLPEFFQMFGRFIRKMKKTYADLQGGMNQLTKEVNIVSGKAQPGDESWRAFLPEDIRNLPADFRPGSMSAEQHAERKAKIDNARRQAEEAKPKTEIQKESGHE